MALRALQGPTGGGAPVGGTGTTNTIPRWTGPSTLGDSQLKDNGTLVGIGASLTSGNRLVIGGVASGTSFIKANEATFQIGNIFAGPVQILTGDAPQVTVTGTGYVGIGTASPTDSGGWSAGRILDVRSGSAGASAVIYVGDSGRATNTQLGFYGTGYGFVGTVTNYPFRILQNNALRGEWTTTSLDISSTSGYGLKLPATPGNADTQTLDCYEENTWTPTRAGFGGTNPTVTASYTRVGRLVTITVRIVATGGAQYSGTSPTTTLSMPATITPAANTTASSIMVYGDTTTVGTVTAWNDGLIYLPTFALTTQQTAFSITYRV